MSWRMLTPAPSGEGMKKLSSLLKKPEDRRAGLEDIAWHLLDSK